MLGNLVKKLAMKTLRRSFDVGAICLFLYSVWFYVTAQNSSVVKTDSIDEALLPIHKKVSNDVKHSLWPETGDPKDRIEDIPRKMEKVFDDRDTGDLFEREQEQIVLNKAGNPILQGEISMQQKQLNYISEHLTFSMKIEPGAKVPQVLLTMTNDGDEDINRGNWYIVFCHLGAYAKDNTRFSIRNIQGFMFTMTPKKDFSTFGPGSTFSFQLGGLGSASNIYYNWYVAEDGLEPRVIESATRDKLSVDYSSFSDHNIDKRFKNNRDIDVENLDPQMVHVVPSPLNTTYSGKKVHSIGKWTDWVIMHTSDVDFEAQYLSKKLGGLAFNFTHERNFIQMTTGKVKVPHVNPELAAQAYKLWFDSKQGSITIIGQTQVGVFYGVQTLLGLISKNGQFITEIPEFLIIDYPRLPYRGLMVDVGRTFMKKKDILELLDIMAMYKLNKLHLHLTDDQGWRLEIPGLEELTKVGGRRSYDLLEKESLLPFFGAGPHGILNTIGSGFYTVADYREILRYANDRHIQLIPEIDMPGHSHAAITAMQARTKWLRALGDSSDEALKYALMDPGDTSKYTAVNGFKKTTLNPCMNSTFAFLEHVIASIKDMHKDIQPLTIFHIGGDEVPDKALTQSPICADFKIHHPDYKTTSQIKQYFMIRSADLLRRNNLTMQVWEDGIYNRKNKSFSVGDEKDRGVWAQIWQKGKKSRIYALAKEGYKIILSEAEFVYFDHLHEPHPEERGFKWATPSISIRKAFMYTPLAESQGVRPHAINNIKGMEAAIWGETIQSMSDFNMMLYPRLLAFSERAWHKASWEDIESEAEKQQNWIHFSNILVQKELFRLEQRGIEYYLPPPGVKETGAKIQVNTALPGLVVQISTDSGRTWTDFKNGTQVSPGKIGLATRSHNSQRHSRVVWLNVE